MKKSLSLFALILSFSTLSTGCGNTPPVKNTDEKNLPTVENNIETPITEKIEMEDVLSFDNIEKHDYRATLKFIGKKGETMPLGNITMEFDAPNKTRILVDSPMGKLESIETDGILYTKMAGKWMELPNDSDIDENQDSFSAEEVGKMLDSPTLKYIGKEDCIVGKCKVYLNTLEAIDGEKTFIYIDPNKNLPVKIKVEMETGTMTMDYEYMDISIEVPETTEEFKMPNIEGMDFENMDIPDINS